MTKMLRDVLTFVVVNKETVESLPPAWYAKEILRGGQGILSEKYLQDLSRKMGVRFSHR
jgi:hypothetical protein